MALASVAVLTASGPAMAGSQAAQAAGRPVVLVGITGLRWSDVSATATPAIWRLAESGSVGSLVTTTVHTATCGADAWLTLNAGTRAAEQPRGPVRCPAVRISPQPGERARVPAMTALEHYNAATGYGPRWGELAKGAGRGRCATAIGPGAGLALADQSGSVARYLPALPAEHGSARAALTACPLTLVDLGGLPLTSSREGRLASDDRQVAAITANAPAGAIVVLAGLGDDGASPHLRVIAASGPGYVAGTLTSESTRQPGIVAITDLTPSVFRWRGQPEPAGVSGSAITAAGRGPLQAAITSMIGQDTANQVYRSIVGWFFLYYGVAEAAVFALIALALRGAGERASRRVAWYTAAGVFGAALPAGTFLAGLVPWGQFAHPALWLYGLGFAWAALIAVAALAGPWRRQPFGPPGFACAVTLAVIGIDVMTGSRLQLGAPFGLSLVEAGRFYGVGNNALGVYAVAGMLTAGWAAVAVFRGSQGRGLAPPGRERRRAAVAAAAAVALVTIIASGWPGFGAKVGGTIALVPAYLVLLAAVAGVVITPRRWLIIAVSGVALVAVFAVLDYAIPAIGPSHLSGFVGQVLHGGAGGTLHRKISSNLHSLTETWFTPVIPVVAVVTGLMLAWPARVRLRTFQAASKREPLLRPILGAVWLAVVLGWLADDSGVSVAAAALPVALPLAIVMTVRVSAAPVTGRTVDHRSNLCAAGQ